MIPRISALLAALPLIATLAKAATGVPAPPPVSTMPSCFAACPLGDLHIVATVRDLGGNPIAGSSVALDFSLCPEAFVCTLPPTDPYVYDAPSRTIRMLTDAAGRVDFPLRVGGVCGPGSVRIYADGVFMASYALVSPDQDGDGQTSNLLNSDHAIFLAKLGTSDPTADFDCDGDVDTDDQGVYFSHASQTCEGWVDPVQRSSWGRLKSFYR